MPSELARPMTAIRGAGYSSAGRSKYLNKKIILKIISKRKYF